MIFFIFSDVFTQNNATFSPGEKLTYRLSYGYFEPGIATIELKPGIQDMISCFYRLRTLDFKKATVGQIFTIYVFVDGNAERIRIKYVGKENKTIDKGTFRCLKFRPVLAKNKIFEKEEDLNVWISDDDNHIPILAEVTIWVGSIKVELIGYSGLTNPVALVK